MTQKSAILIVTVFIVLMTITFYHVAPANAIIWIGGNITSDTTWTPVDTYRMINNTYVDSGVTLTILPGVNVQIADGFSLIVQGSLNATGTDANPIVFTSSRANPSAGAWNTIDFNGASNCSFTLDHATIEFAVNGITIESQGYATIARSELFNCSRSGIMINGISNVAIEENTIRYNQNGIATDSHDHAGIVIGGNIISSNTQNGIYLYALEYSIYNVTFSSNTVSSNAQNGIYLNGYVPGAGGWGYMRYIYNVTFSSNTVSSNAQNGIYVHGGPLSPPDVTASNNRIAGNQIGMYFWNSQSNITENSVLYSQCGVLYQSTTRNLATRNDIYSNTYGMNVTQGATVNAEYNYWGDSTGPYQLSVNPEGKGNPVNGNGVDLDFIPFLTSPQGQIRQRPVAALSANEITLGINETVTYSAIYSTSDGRIDSYFFDFGDGTNSSWTTLPEVLHQYGSAGTYYANLTVMDDYGVTSNNTAIQAITVSTQIPEFPSFLILPSFMIAALLVILVDKRKHTSKVNGR